MYDGGFGGGGFDWNGNGHRDVGDSYMDYKIMNEKGGGGGGHGSGGSGGDGCGCIMLIGLVLGLLYLLGSCS